MPTASPMLLAIAIQTRLEPVVRRREEGIRIAIETIDEMMTVGIIEGMSRGEREVAVPTMIETTIETEAAGKGGTRMRPRESGFARGRGRCMGMTDQGEDLEQHSDTRHD